MKAVRAKVKTTATKATSAKAAAGAKAPAATVGSADAAAPTETPAKRTRTKKAVEEASAPVTAQTGPAPADGEFDDDAAATIEADVAAFANGVDLDDQTPAMGDSVHTYLKSIGRTSLLTAEQEVDLAKRIKAGLFAEHKLDSDPDVTPEMRRDLEMVAEDGGARRRTCSRPTFAWSCRSPRSTATAACPCSMSCRKGTWA